MEPDLTFPNRSSYVLGSATIPGEKVGLAFPATSIFQGCFVPVSWFAAGVLDVMPPLLL